MVTPSQNPSSPRLSVEELAELLDKQRRAKEELSKPGPLTQAGFEARKAFIDALLEKPDALLAMATELVRAESAAEWFGDTLAEMAERAANLGWHDPTTPKVGG